MSRPAQLFLAVCAVVFVANLSLWVAFGHSAVLDVDSWTSAANLLAHGTLVPTTDTTYGYPATTLLIPMALLIRTGVSATMALGLAVSLLMALAIAGSATLAYVLRPTSWWWLTTAIVLVCSRSYLAAVPPSLIAAPLVALIVLLVLAVYERGRACDSWLLVTLGMVCGSALATRIDIALAITGCALLFLLPTVGRRLWITLLATLLTFTLLDPYLWFAPLHHLIAIYEKIHLHYFVKTDGLTMTDILEFAPLSLLSFVFSAVILAVRPHLVPVPRAFLLWLMATTLMVGTAILLSHYHPVWYFFPLLLPWDVFFPLFLLHALTNRFRTPAVCLVLAGQFVLFVQMCVVS